MDMGSILSSVISSPRVNVWAAQRFQGRSRVARGPFTLLPVSKQASAAKVCFHLV